MAIELSFCVLFYFFINIGFHSAAEAVLEFI